MNNNNLNNANKSLQAQIVAQWITSLAISVVCCAVLFIVFAGYIVELHDTTNLLTVKLEVLQERHNQLNSELTLMKRPTVVQISNGTAKAAPAPLSGEAAVPAAEGQPVDASAPAPGAPSAAAQDGMADKLTKDDLMPVMNESVPPEQVLPKADVKTPAPKK